MANTPQEQKYKLALQVDAAIEIKKINIINILSVWGQETFLSFLCHAWCVIERCG